MGRCQCKLQFPRETPMAFALFKKRLTEPPVTPAGPETPAVAAAVAAPAAGSEHEAAQEILELLELELGALVRQLERAAHSVAGGAQSTAATLTTIRQRTEALTGRSAAAQSTATTFAEAAEKFTHSAQDIGSQVRDAGKL